MMQEMSNKNFVGGSLVITCGKIECENVRSSKGMCGIYVGRRAKKVKKQTWKLPLASINEIKCGTMKRL